MRKPTNTRWITRPGQGIDALEKEDDIAIPDLTAEQCLVEIKAASLNYRDLAIATGKYPWPLREALVPVSDGAGQVIATGDGVSTVKVGDRVCMLFMQEHQDGIITPKIRQSSLGSQRDGVLQKFAVFDAAGLVKLPDNITYVEASTLPCAAVTAWNCLFGLPGKALLPGDTLLTLGSGGVSLFAIQIAVALGARVISTTSADEKEKFLKSLGVTEVINYKKNVDWGVAAKLLTPDGLGVHHVVEVGGETTISQSLHAIRPEGVVCLVGFLGGKSAKVTTFSRIQDQNCIVRGINVGSRRLFDDLNTFLSERGIKPIVADRKFGFEEVKEAYQYMEQQDFLGKIVIEIS